MPRSAAKGSRAFGSSFFGLRFFDESKKGRSAAGPRPGLEKTPPGRVKNPLTAKKAAASQAPEYSKKPAHKPHQNYTPPQTWPH